MSMSETLSRKSMAALISARLQQREPKLRAEFAQYKVKSCVVDDLLPEEIAHKIHAAFPDVKDMRLKRSWREDKYVAVQMNRYAPLLEEAIFAFQEPEVLDVIERITSCRELQPDVNLYAGGLSTMLQGQFLSPHVDNSHDGKQERYRVLNLLFYVSPDWHAADGGSLELWDDGMTRPPRTIASSFNRLVIMQTDTTSLHSVGAIRAERPRCCVSNYYFSTVSPLGHDYFHATEFRAWPGSPFRDMVLRADAAMRTLLLKTVLRKGRYKNPHIYKR